MSVTKKVWGAVSDSLADRLNRRAEKEGRSLSSLVAYLLERVMEGYDEDSPPPDTQKSA